MVSQVACGSSSRVFANPTGFSRPSRSCRSRRLAGLLDPDDERARATRLPGGHRVVAEPRTTNRCREVDEAGGTVQEMTVLIFPAEESCAQSPCRLMPWKPVAVPLSEPPGR